MIYQYEYGWKYISYVGIVFSYYLNQYSYVLCDLINTSPLTEPLTELKTKFDILYCLL